MRSWRTLRSIAEEALVPLGDRRETKAGLSIDVNEEKAVFWMGNYPLPAENEMLAEGGLIITRVADTDYNVLVEAKIA